MKIDNAIIAKNTRKSPVLSKELNYVQSGLPKHNDENELQPFFSRSHELSVDNGDLLWGLRVIIPEKLRDFILAELHDQH